MTAKDDVSFFLSEGDQIENNVETKQVLYQDKDGYL
jgi:hypothetical protein